ncbi:MAG: dicarboxylate/amino acid:cation symporter [Spirochaetaceae bacterium]|jgi:Na+/H+-dicarboxylate symporter|nr:dicarboxylate/amino acid:cation symporter [Spirochaetaceae bacterium]
MKKLFQSLPFRLILALAIGIVLGLAANEIVMQIVMTVQKILSQVIMFAIPLVILGFITPSITKLGSSASKILGVALVIAYTSTICAAFISMIAGYGIIPHLNIVSSVEESRELPKVIFELMIPQIMPVMSALVLALFIGLSAVWTKSKLTIALLDEFQKIVVSVVTMVIIPLLPFFIGCTFCGLAYEGTITKQLPVFLIVIIIVMIGHYLWLTVLYTIAGLYSGKNSLKVLKHYGPAYLTAVGTMSSAATLPVALSCANKAAEEGTLRKDMAAFGIPLFANIHLCGSVLTETFFVMVVSKILYGVFPVPGTMILFCLLLGIFAIAAPGVPGGTVMASLGLIVSVLGFEANGTALMLTIFALQDSFGTACNVTGDGALTLILTGFAEKHKLKEQNLAVDL